MEGGGVIIRALSFFFFLLLLKLKLPTASPQVLLHLFLPTLKTLKKKKKALKCYTELKTDIIQLYN